MLEAYNEVTAPHGWTECRPIGIAVHHTVTDLPADATEAQERAHIRAIDRGHVALDYGSFGYHGITFKSGRSYATGYLNAGLAHVKSRNHELLGWAVVGDYSRVEPTPKVLSGLKEGLRHLLGTANLPIMGHDKWALPGNGTKCPGSLRNVAFETLVSNPSPVWTPDRAQIAHALHFAYTGYVLNDKSVLKGTDRNVLEFLADWYDS